MDELGGYRELPSGVRWLGAGVLLGGLLLSGVLERLQSRLKEEEGAVWWVSNGRDVLNAFAFAVVTLGLRAFGFVGPVALCVAASLVLATSLIQPLILERHWPAAASLLAALGVGLPVVLAPRWVSDAYLQTLRLLFSGTA